MRFFYRFLLRLQSRRVREDFGAEMVTVFDDAAADARARGLWAYAGFSLRELGGLVRRAGSPGLPSFRWRLPVTGAALGLAIGWVATLLMPEQFVSTASIRIARQAVAENFVPAPPLNAGMFAASVRQTILSRRTLSNVIQTHGLYIAERQRMPMEDLIERARKAIKFESTDGEFLRVEFTYHDRLLAQKTVHDLVRRVIDEALREREAFSHATVEFLRGQVRQTAETWEDSAATLRAAKPDSHNFERLQLDRDLARRRYETVRTLLAEAETLEDLEKRRQGATIEMVDLPSLPQSPLRSHWMVIITATAIGLLAGLLAQWWRAPRIALLETVRT